jgi:ankyrin repeat protein
MDDAEGPGVFERVHPLYEEFTDIHIKRKGYVTPSARGNQSILSLCHAQQWDKVIIRCQTNPEEADIRTVERLEHGKSKRSRISSDKEKYENESSYLVFHQTPLGIVCRAAAPREKKLDLINYLLIANPDQLHASQYHKGNTPLRDLVLSEVCEVCHLKRMLNWDTNLRTAHQRDSDGLTPLDHIIMRIHVDPSESNIRLFKHYVENVGDDMISSSIIRLLSSSRNDKNLGSIQSLVPQAIYKCTKYLLRKNPECIRATSSLTGCSSLHVALRNFGHEENLLSLLLESDTNMIMVQHRNLFGDLPIHIACACGSPTNILKLILEKCRLCHKVSCNKPHPLIWSANFSGFTPIDLEWIRHMEGGGGSLLGESHSLASLTLQEPGYRRYQPQLKGFYRTLLNEAANQAMKQKNGLEDLFSNLVLERISLIIHKAHSSEKESNRLILHAISSLHGYNGLTFPIPLLSMFQCIHKEKIKIRDEKGRLPLHYAVMNNKLMDFNNLDMTRSSKENNMVVSLLEIFPDGAKFVDFSNRLPIHYALDCSEINLDVVSSLVSNFPESVNWRDPRSGLYPFQQAGMSDTGVSYYLLRRDPNLVIPAFLIHK